MGMMRTAASACLAIALAPGAGRGDRAAFAAGVGDVLGYAMAAGS